MTYKCYCRCHNAVALLFGVNVTDPVEAEAACDSCKDEHPARRHSGIAGPPRPKFLPPTHWTPKSDATGDGPE